MQSGVAVSVFFTPAKAEEPFPKIPECYREINCSISLIDSPLLPLSLGIADAVDDKQTLQSSFDKDKNASPEIPWYWLLNLKGHKTAADIFPTRIWRWHNFLIQSKEVKTFSGDFTARGDRVNVV
ncbi:hypothetical protein C2S52_017584 [Perilla frutescens var. hirtella]|nr:hypothetical protein C2S52_017584 [Perilla frutescens var. hirtella]